LRKDKCFPHHELSAQERNNETVTTDPFIRVTWVAVITCLATGRYWQNPAHTGAVGVVIRGI
jgi:hypothetical protein